MLLIWMLACADKPDPPCFDGYVRGDDGNCEVAPDADSGDASDADDTDAPTTGADDTDAPVGDDTDTRTGSDDTGATDTGLPTPAGLPQGFTSGDPITLVETVRPAIDDNPHSGFESVDTIIVDDQYGFSVGQGGWVLTDLDTGELLGAEQADRGYYITLDEESAVAWVSTREFGIYSLDISDFSDVRMERSTWRPAEGAYAEDLSYDDGRLAVATTGGVSFFTVTSGTGHDEVSFVPAAQPKGMALHGDRALYTDGYDLVLLDVSDLTDPVELDRVTMNGKGHDIAFDGARVGVALGGYGFGVFDVEGDVIIDRGDFETPGSCFSVDLDGEYLWAAAWEQVVLAWVGDGDPVVLGHEPITQYGLGVGASSGRAAVADWYYVTTFLQTPETGGPEIDVASKISMSPDGDYDVVTFTNAGAQTLEVTLTPPDDTAFTIGETELIIEPGRSGYTTLEFAGGQTSTELRFTSNDPDETSGEVILSSQQTSVGSPHQDMELWGIQPPSTDLALYNLQDQRGSVVLLVYFALY